MSQAGMIRVVIADDHPSVRTALRHVLEIEADFEVVGEAHDGAHAVEIAERTQPDLVVLDYRMPQLNGVDAAREILRRFPDVILVMLSGDEDATVATEAAEAGVASYVSKSDRPEELLVAMRRAAGGPDPSGARRPA
jgi:DNA-binding NarL/FixJ family response regulator